MYVCMYVRVHTSTPHRDLYTGRREERMNLYPYYYDMYPYHTAYCLFIVGSLTTYVQSPKAFQHRHLKAVSEIFIYPKKPRARVTLYVIYNLYLTIAPCTCTDIYHSSVYNLHMI